MEVDIEASNNILASLLVAVIYTKHQSKMYTPLPANKSDHGRLTLFLYIATNQNMGIRKKRTRKSLVTH